MPNSDLNAAPLLSICIPTYNRRDLLRETLNSLTRQTGHDAEQATDRAIGHAIGPGQVEICVSDNGSEDGTAAFLQSFAETQAPNTAFFGFRYQIQPENLGIDRNMQAVTAMGRGRYIFPLGDDDVLTETGLAVILDALKDAPDVMILNGWHTDHQLNPRQHHLPQALCHRRYADPGAAFADLWDKMPFGSFLAKKHLFAEPLFQRYMGTSHGYTGAVWDGLVQHADLDTGGVRTLETPVVLLRGGAKTWSASEARIMLIEIPLWMDLVGHSAAYATRAQTHKAIGVHRAARLKNLLRYRASGQITAETTAALSQHLTPVDRGKLWGMSWVPIPVARALMRLVDRRWRAETRAQ